MSQSAAYRQAHESNKQYYVSNQLRKTILEYAFDKFSVVVESLWMCAYKSSTSPDPAGVYCHAE